MNIALQFPPQLLSSSKKTFKWRKACVDYIDSRMNLDYLLIRNSTKKKKINYDLLNDKIHMEDLLNLLNPEDIKAEFLPKNILHYGIISPKLNVLIGEEGSRDFHYRAIVTNPTAISEMEESKKQALMESLKKEIEDTSLSEEELQQRLTKLNDYYTYDWLDSRESRVNFLLNHYSRELNFKLTFNRGYKDALIVGEEIYQCDIVGNEPVLERVNPCKIIIYRSGYSNKIEDADIVILKDYWSLGKVYDTYGDVLTKKDLEKIEKTPGFFGEATDGMDNWNETNGWVNTHMISDTISNSAVFFDPLGEYSDGLYDDNMPYDNFGNIRVVRVYWKSRRKIKKVKFYDPETGEEDFTFMPESYTANESKGEEEYSLWVNEAWEGTKIGKDIYVNIRPRPVQYNRLSNPGRCHFGIVGSIYNLNDDKPHSMVDMMKPFSYMYDVIHDRLNKVMAKNWGKMARLDLAKKPASWSMNKWLYYAKTMGLFIEDSFNEGIAGATRGVIAGGINNNSQGVIDADFGNNIQQYINLLEFIKLEMAEVVGISKQREGLISNRETVGGVERATLQSSHITEWMFMMHNDVRKRTLEVFIETAKAALRGRNKKFQYLLPDASMKVVEIDGDEFSECDYGIVIDNSNDVLELNQKLETLALAALQNQTLSFSTIMKLYRSCSLAEKQRFVENDELRLREERQQQQQQQIQLLQQQQQAQLENLLAERLLKDNISIRENQTRIEVAKINSEAELAILQIKNNMTKQDVLEKLVGSQAMSKEKLLHEMELMDKKFQLERERMLMEDKQFNQTLQFLKDKQKANEAIKRLLIANK